MTTLAELTTFRVGGEVSRLVRAASSEELVAAVRAADEEQRQLLVLGGGSNLLAMLHLMEPSSLCVLVHKSLASLTRMGLIR